MTYYEYLVTWLRARFTETERAAAVIEYALLVALIATVCLVAVQVLGSTTSSRYSNVASHVANAN